MQENVQKINYVEEQTAEQKITERNTAKTGEVEVKINKVKQVSVNTSLDLDYKFDIVENEQAGQLSFKQYDYSVFKGMTDEIKKIEDEYNKIATNSMYSAEFISDKRTDALLDIMSIESKYKDKALKQVNELRQVKMTSKYMSAQDEQVNMLKRLNNSIICSELMKTATVEELASLYENNKDNVDIRTMIKSRVGHLFRVVKDNAVRDKAFAVMQKIKEQELEIKNPAYFKELDLIERSIKNVFNREGMYAEGLENGFNKIAFRKYFS